MNTKIYYNFRTLDDSLVQLSLEGLSKLDDKDFSRDFYMVVGGCAVQSYLQDEQRRSTADVDVLVGKPLHYADFKRFAQPMFDFLKEEGYKVKTKKNHLTYCFEVTKDDENILIEFMRKNLQNFEKHKKRIHRELENSRRKSLQHEEGVVYKVSSPEDIVVPKLVRILHSHKRGVNFKKYDLKRLLKHISRLRENAILRIGDEESAAKLRVNSDAYDIMSLYSQVGLNESYFSEASKDWDTLKENIKGKDEILDFLLPTLKF